MNKQKKSKKNVSCSDFFFKCFAVNAIDLYTNSMAETFFFILNKNLAIRYERHRRPLANCRPPLELLTRQKMFNYETS